MKIIIKLTCKAVKFHSSGDENSFFEWLGTIKSIVKRDAAYDELYLYFEDKNIPEKDLRELISLFFRYKVDMKQLQVFLTEENKDWLQSKKAYWKIIWE